jgi:hypothetical protein
MEDRIKWLLYTKLTDGDEELEHHIIPLDTKITFDTREETEAFAARINEFPEWCARDDDGELMGTFYGHIPSADCVCEPELESGEIPMYSHRMSQ